MKEESRIEALEHEVKILKNEIQATLLEIREQILNHYYPELRAEEPLRSHSLPVRPAIGNPGAPIKMASANQDAESTLSEIAAKGQVNPFSDIFLEDLEGDELPDIVTSSDDDNYLDDDDDYDNDCDDEDMADQLKSAFADIEPNVVPNVAKDGAKTSQASTATSNPVQSTGPVKAVSATVNHGNAAPTTREVDFRKLKQASAAPAAPSNGPASAPTAREYVREEVAVPVELKANRINMAALATWVTDGVAHVGKEHTLQIIDTYASGGKVNEATKQSLLRMVSRAADFEPDKPVGSRDMLTLMVGLDQILE